MMSLGTYQLLGSDLSLLRREAGRGGRGQGSGGKGAGSVMKAGGGVQRGGGRQREKAAE